jgi:hypothetical protein
VHFESQEAPSLAHQATHGTVGSKVGSSVSLSTVGSNVGSSVSLSTVGSKVGSSVSFSTVGSNVGSSVSLSSVGSNAGSRVLSNCPHSSQPEQLAKSKHFLDQGFPFFLHQGAHTPVFRRVVGSAVGVFISLVVGSNVGSAVKSLLVGSKVGSSVSVSKVSHMEQTLHWLNFLHFSDQGWALVSHHRGQESTAQKFNNPSHFSFDNV